MEKIKVGIVGAGTMGNGIAQVVATAGHQTVLFDLDPLMLKRAKDYLTQHVARFQEKGKITTEKGKQILDNILFANSPKEFENSGLVIEAIVENLEIKQKLFNDIEKIIEDKCVLATNTSSLSVTSIAAVCNKPERVIGIHFFNPAPLMPLVEIIPGLATHSNITTEIKNLITEWGKVTVVAKDTPGFIVNRIARPFYGEAIRIYEESIAEIATIDWAMKEIGGFKMGPFELMDMIGNDINYTVTETVWKQLFFDARYKPSLTQKRMVEARRLGKKAGRGYYNYSPHEVPSSPNTDKGNGEKIFMRIISMLINEAADALYLQVASKDDIDLAMTKGVNYPKGLLKWCDEIGADKIYNTINYLREEYAEDRYRPSLLLKKMAKEKSKFYG